MPEVTEHAIDCPYCGEPITVLVDNSLPEQEYIEDCQVCCRPMQISLQTDGGEIVAVTVDCAS